MTTLKQFLHDKSNKSEVDKYFEDQAKLVLEKRKLEVIDNFNDYFDFLNNEFPCQVYYQGLIFRSVAHAYQAARSSQQHMREKIMLADSLAELYDIAGKIEDPPNWQNDRLRVMEKLLRDKFRRNRDLRDKLKATGTRDLINTYWEQSTSNVYWGIVEGKGQNQLGRQLQNIRNDIITNVEIDKWLFSTFDLQDNKFFLPLISLEIAKQDQAMQKILLVGKAYYLMGKLKTADVITEHPSLSRNHACLIVDINQGVCLVDLGSKSGSYVDGKRINDCVPHPLKSGQKLNFGASSRKYTIEIDFSEVEKNIDIRKKMIERELKSVETVQKSESTSQLFKSKLPDIQEDTLFVGNLPTTATKKEIEELFSKYGKVKEVRIPMDHKTNTQKSICFVTFKEAADCKKALNSAGVGLKIGENKLKISAAKRQETRDDDRVERGKYARDSKKYEERGKEDIDRRYSKRGERRGDYDRKKEPRRSRRDSRERKNGSDKKDRSPTEKVKEKKKENQMEVESDEAKSPDSGQKKQEKRKKSRDRSAEKDKKTRKSEKEEKENKYESKRDTKGPKQETSKPEEIAKRESNKRKDEKRPKSSSSSEEKVKKRKKRSSTPEKKRDHANDKKKTRKRSRSRSSSKERRRSPKKQENKKNVKKDEKKVEKEESSDSSDDSSSSDDDAKSDSDSSASD